MGAAREGLMRISRKQLAKASVTALALLGIAGSIVLSMDRTAQSAETGVPTFTFDGTWPKMPLPNKWTFEGITGLAVDKDPVAAHAYLGRLYEEMFRDCERARRHYAKHLEMGGRDAGVAYAAQVIRTP